MAAFTLKEVLDAVRGELLQRGEHASCSGVSTDTRTIQEGNLFIPLIGENFNGHHFLNQAAAKGASMVILSEKEWVGSLPSSVTVVLVNDTKQALERIAAFHRMRFSIPVVAVTGSNGKTTTKDMITAVLKTTFQVCHTRKNFNNEIGLSQTLLGLTDKDQVCVVEMGMRGMGQIAELCRIAHPTIGIVTNVGTSHIGLLGSRANIAKAKGELIEALPAEGVAVLNGDDDFAADMVKSCKGQNLTYGLSDRFDMYGSELHFLPDMTSFICHSPDDNFPVHLQLLGIHNVYDALAAAAVGHLLHVPNGQIGHALSAFVSQSDSQKLISVQGAAVLDDSYNANPLSVEMAMRALQQIPGKRHILVLGDMLELGCFEEALHRGIGKKAAAMGFDALITVGTLSRFTSEAAKQCGMDVVVSFDDCQSAAVYLKNHVRPGDAVLIKGSHAMHMETIPRLWRGATE